MRMAMITDKYSYEYYHSLELQVNTTDHLPLFETLSKSFSPDLILSFGITLRLHH